MDNEAVTDDAAAEPRDASDLGMAAARAAWAEAARDLLIEKAGSYRALVTLKQLSTGVQERSGITTTAPMHTWLADVLARVAAECQARDEPLLSSLCVSMQGSVGQAYADVVEQVRGERPEDPDEHAASERLECYRHWEAVGLPRDGGTPLRTAHFTPVKRAAASRPAARATTPRKAAATRRTPAAAMAAPVEKPLNLCSRCFTEMPATGVCDYCD